MEGEQRPPLQCPCMLLSTKASCSAQAVILHTAAIEVHFEPVETHCIFFQYALNPKEKCPASLYIGRGQEVME